MANKYYDPSGYPQTGAPGSSAAMRSELATIATGFEGVEQDIDDALTGASGAATTATAQAGIATTQAGISTTQAGIATTQAGISTSQAGIATTQAGIASDKAAEAAATKLAVDATYDEFDDRYLGRKASDPTVDNDGNALQKGTLYFNTTTDTFKGYNGSAWINLPATAASNLTFTPAGGVSATDVQAAIEELDTEKLSAGAGAVGETNLADEAVTGDKLETIISGGSVGSESQIPVITYDTKGRITAITFANAAAPTVLNGTNDSTFASASDEDPVSPEWVNGRFSDLMSGIVFDWPGPSAPPGAMALPLVPTNVSRTTYSKWFAKYGTQFGSGDGSTTFGMPYCPENFSFIQANGNVGSSSNGQMPSHAHSASLFTSGGTGNFAAASSGTPAGSASTGSVGSGSANLAAGIRMLKCIWL